MGSLSNQGTLDGEEGREGSPEFRAEQGFRYPTYLSPSTPSLLRLVKRPFLFPYTNPTPSSQLLLFGSRHVLRHTPRLVGRSRLLRRRCVHPLSRGGHGGHLPAFGPDQELPPLKRGLLEFRPGVSENRCDFKIKKTSSPPEKRTSCLSPYRIPPSILFRRESPWGVEESGGHYLIPLYIQTGEGGVTVVVQSLRVVDASVRGT